MALLNHEPKILTEAMTALKDETGIVFDVQPVSERATDIDALLKIRHRNILISAEIKKGIKPANFGAIAHQLKRLNQPSLLITDYVSPNIGKKLKEQDIQFIDSCGNAYLNLPSIYVHVIGQKPSEDVLDSKKSKNKAFDVTGLKLIYGFLCDDNLINASYREMSERTGVALGAIGKLLNDLKEAGYLLGKGDTRRLGLINRRKLLERWVEAYPEKLKPKLLVGEFVSDDHDWWQKIKPEKFGAYWGGEVAAAQYTNYLRPQEFTIYLPELAGNKLLATARLRKAHFPLKSTTEGLVKIYRPFWRVSDTDNERYALFVKGTVHPILIYADLIASADSRNLETARILYDSTIAEYIGKD